MTSWLLSFETTTTPKLNLEHIELSFESKRKKKKSARTVAQSEWFEWNRVPTRSPSPAGDREVTEPESGNGPLFFRAR